MSEDVDWNKANIKDRKVFFTIVNKLRVDKKWEWNDIFIPTIGEDHTFDQDVRKRFAKGKLARSSCTKIYKWMQQNYPEYAKEAEYHYYQNIPKPQKWLEFIKQNGKFKNVSISSPNSFGIVAFTPDEPTSERVLKRLEKFCFEINSPMKGQAIAFQEYKDNWYILKLTKNLASHQAKIGKQYMPSHNGQPISLQERHDMGDHRFLFFITGNDEFTKTIECLPKEGMIAPSVLNEFSTAIGALEDEWCILRINVVFKD